MSTSTRERVAAGGNTNTAGTASPFACHFTPVVANVDEQQQRSQPVQHEDSTDEQWWRQSSDGEQQRVQRHLRFYCELCWFVFLRR